MIHWPGLTSSPLAQFRAVWHRIGTSLTRCLSCLCPSVTDGARLVCACRLRCIQRFFFSMPRSAVRCSAFFDTRFLPGRTVLCGAVLLLLLTGCAVSGPQGALVSSSASETEVEQRLRAEATRWSGTPHQWGGHSRRGVDCSGLTQRFYADLFGVDLPRTTGRQVKQGRSVPKRALQAGDLVFFRPSRKTRHVGIYLSDGEFAHASSSQGVTVSRLSEAYWRDRYWTARRLLQFGAPAGRSAAAAPTQPDTRARPALAPPPPASGERTGW